MDEGLILSDSKLPVQDRLLASLSYIWALGIVVYLFKKENDYIAFHARQSIVLFLASVCVAFLPFLGSLLTIVYVVLVIAGAIKASWGERWRIPYVAVLADKIKL